MPARNQAKVVAKKEGAKIRRRKREVSWEEITAYGRAKAKELGITEADVIPLIQEYRREQRAKALIDKEIAEGLEDIRAGRTHGPFASADDAVAFLHREAKKTMKHKNRASPAR